MRDEVRSTDDKNDDDEWVVEGEESYEPLKDFDDFTHTVIVLFCMYLIPYHINLMHFVFLTLKISLYFFLLRKHFVSKSSHSFLS